MKKVYLSALALTLGATSVNAQLDLPQLNTERPTHSSASPSVNRALGQDVYNDDFSDATLWTIDNDGESGAQFGWNIDATNDSWYLLDIASTSGGDFAEVNNGDATQGTQILDKVYTMTTSAPLDILNLTQTATGTATDEVNVSFEQYGATFNDLQELQVSTDGNTFTTVYDNSNREALTASGGSAYANTEKVYVNISDAIAGNGSSVWFRFRWTTASTNVTSPNVWITYGWMIDDLAISTLNDYDLSVVTSEWGSYSLDDGNGGFVFNGMPYYTIPLSQLGQMSFNATVRNQGGLDLTNVQIDVDVNGTVTSSTPTTVVAGTTDSLALNLTLPGAGVYTVSQSISMTETDDVPSDNDLYTIPQDITVEANGHIFARDENQNFGIGGGNTDVDGSEVQGFEAGNYFEILADQTVAGIDVGIADNQDNVGDEIYVAIYSRDANGFVLEGVSDFHTVNPEYLGEIITFNFPSAIQLQAATGLYFACVGTQDDFEYMTSGFSPRGLSLIYYGGGMAAPVTNGNFFTSATPVVRLNFQGTVGLEDEANVNATLGQNAPNPFATTSTIEFELTETANVSFEIRDLSGKIVETADLGKMNAGTQSYTVDASNLSSGIYTYTMTTGEKSVTKKMVVKK